MIRKSVLFLVTIRIIDATNKDNTIRNKLICLWDTYSFLYLMIINEINNTVEVNKDDSHESLISKEMGSGKTEEIVSLRNMF